MKSMRVELSEDIKQSNELQEVFSSIAHQWRQPLSEINSIVSNIDNRLYALRIEDAEVAQNLEAIERLTKSMSESIDDFRNYFRFKCEENYKLKEIITEAVDSTFYSLKENAVELDIAVENNLDFFGDRRLLKQILVTLIDNARDALVARNIYKPEIKIKAFLENEAMFIKLCDNAGGISKSVMEKIFDPTFTTKHHSHGTGLGLFMVKKLLQERLHASLSVENVDSGVCFTIEFSKAGMKE